MAELTLSITTEKGHRITCSVRIREDGPKKYLTITTQNGEYSCIAVLEEYHPLQKYAVFMLNNKRIKAYGEKKNERGKVSTLLSIIHQAHKKIASYRIEQSIHDTKKTISSKHDLLTPPDTLYSPLAGKIIKRYVSAQQIVKVGEPLLVIESMKMENEIRADRDGLIKTISIKEGDVVHTNQALICFEIKSFDHGKELK